MIPSRIMRVKLLPSYPVALAAGTAISIDTAAGTKTIRVDYAKQALTDGIADPSTAEVLVKRSTGGYERARLDQLVFPAAGQRTPVGNMDSTVVSTDRVVAFTAAHTAPRVTTLCAANSVAGGTAISFIDEVLGITSTSTRTITRAGSDTINGATTWVLANSGAGVTLISDGVSKWTVSLVGAANAVYADFRAAPKRARTITSASSAGDRTLNVADIGKLIIFSGTTDFTVTLTAAATLANGWSMAFRSVGKCVVTLDPNGSETIDGAATGKVLFKQSGEIVCDGTEFFTIGKQNRVLLETQTPSGVSTVDFTSLAPGFKTLIFRARDIAMATAAANLNAQFSIDNGANWRATSGDYLQHNLPMSAGTQTPVVFSTASSLQFLVGNVVVARLHDFDVNLGNPSAAVTRHRGHYVSMGDLDNGGSYLTTTGRFVFIGPSASAINAIRFLTSAGNVSGTIELYGEE